MSKWLEFFRWIATHRAFRQYVTETQGIPEGQDPKKPPFEEVGDSEGPKPKSTQTGRFPAGVAS